MTQDEIIEMAQECNLIGMRPHLDGIYTEALETFAKLVATKAIAELESQEPAATIAVRWHEPVGKVAYVLEVNLPVGVHKLYTHPPRRTWVGLSDEEIKDLYFDNFSMGELKAFGQAIEAKLKEKNT